MHEQVNRGTEPMNSHSGGSNTYSYNELYTLPSHLALNNRIRALSSSLTHAPA